MYVDEKTARESARDRDRQRRSGGGKNLPATGRGRDVAGDGKKAAMNALPGLAEVPVKLRVVLGGSKISFQDAANLPRKACCP